MADTSSNGKNNIPTVENPTAGTVEGRVPQTQSQEESAQKTGFTNPYDLFSGTVAQIPDLKTLTQKIREEIKIEVPIFAGLNIKKWFKDPLKEVLDPFKNFNFKFKNGRVSFLDFEKNFLPKVPNILISGNPNGFQDVISIFENLMDDLKDDEKEDYNSARHRIHLMLKALEKLMEDETEVEFIKQNFADYDIAYIYNFSADWKLMISNADVSLRDQLIDLRTFLSLFQEKMMGVAFEAGNYSERIKNSALRFSTIIDDIDSILVRWSNELETMVERLIGLMTFTPAKRIHRYRINDLTTVLKNPLFKHVKADYIRMQSPSTNSMATSYANKGTDARDKVDAAQNTIPKASVATPDIGVGDKVQAEQQVDTIPFKGTVGPLNETQFENLRKAIRFRESGNNYKIVNRYGYSGAYQFGGPALQDLGYAKKGTTGKGLSNPSNWTGKNGITNREQFLNNNKLQDDTFVIWMKMLYKGILRVGAVSKSDSPATVGGYLAVAHLLGPGGARNLKNGKAGRDGNGTSANEYFNLGSKAVGGELSAGAASGQDNTPAGAAQASANEEAVSNNTIDDGASITVPGQSAASVYPYNKVKFTESGHFEEYDDTPGAERVQIRHRKGSGFELKEDGTTVHFSAKDSYDAVLGDNFIIVSGLCNIYVKGNCGIVSEGDVNINAGQNLNLIAGGDINMLAGGDKSERISGSSATTVANDMAVTSGGFLRQSSDGDMQLESSAFTAISRNGNTSIISQGDVNTVSAGSINSSAAGSISQLAKGNIISVSYGDQTLSASGKMVMGGDSLVAHGASSASMGSDGSTTIMGSGTIRLGAPVEKALYSDTAGSAPDGAANPVTPSGTSTDGGAGKIANDNKKKVEKDPVEKIVADFSASDFNETQARTGGGEGKEPSKVDPYTFA